jgi:hemerythrin-like domain-containing protein
MIGRDARRLVDEPDEVMTVFEEAVDYVVNFQNVYHHPREELMFSRIAERDPSVAATASKLAREHKATDRAGESLLTLISRTSTGARGKSSRERLAQKLEQFAKQMRAHISQEEQVLYSRAWSELDEQDWNEMADAVPPRDPLSKDASKRYPQLARYVKTGSAQSEVSMQSESILQIMEKALDKSLSKTPKLREVKSIARRHGEEAWSLARKSIDAYPRNPLLSPCVAARVGFNGVREFGAAYGRWIREWHGYVWQKGKQSAN